LCDAGNYETGRNNGEMRMVQVTHEEQQMHITPLDYTKACKLMDR